MQMMTAETTRKIEALAQQAQTVMSVFTNAGYDAVAPAIIQPADVFLDAIGESLRARTYVFTDQDGAELCLRPDITVPTCRLHLERAADLSKPARYCYSGPAFRFQPQGATAAHPREFRQAGIERFGDQSREVAEAETVAIIIRAIEKTGFKDWTLRLGDLGLFSSMLDATGVSPNWKKRLDDAFLRPLSFRDALRAFASGARPPSASNPEEVLSAVRRDDMEASEAAVAVYLEEEAIDLIGTRTLTDITEHLLDIAEDRKEEPLDSEAIGLIERYIATSGPAISAGEKISALIKRAPNGSGQALETYDRRLALLANAGINLDRVTFSAEFGRTLAYYTGLVFEVNAAALGPGSPLAGGGRYDALMRAAGAAEDIPAVGAAIHSESLLAALEGRKS
jgi:ATP phosphoribosyltransferase regulatory subunit